MIEGPPFHLAADLGGHLFALAVSRGRYVSPTGATNTPAFLVLYFSHSAEFAPFSTKTISTEGQWLSGTHGDDFLRTLEYALLHVSETERVPLRAWLLYPRASIDDTAFPDGPTRDAYWESRRRLCLMLYPARVRASVAAQVGPVEPLFRYDKAVLRTDYGEHDDPEIFATVVELTPESTGGGDEE
jgi:hypothetical protein